MHATVRPEVSQGLFDQQHTKEQHPTNHVFSVLWQKRNLVLFHVLEDFSIDELHRRVGDKKCRYEKYGYLRERKRCVGYSVIDAGEFDDGSQAFRA